MSADLRRALQGVAPGILKRMCEAALAGDVRAAELVLSRTLASLRQTDEALPVDLGDGSAADRGRRVVDALSVGEVSPMQAEAALATLTSLARLIESVELEQRIAALEAAAEKLRD